RLAALARISLNRLVIVEDDLRIVERGDETQRGEDRLARQIGKDAEPEEEGGLLRVEAGVGETLAEALALEIDGDEGEKMRRREDLLRKPRALPGLSRRMVDREDAQPQASMGITKSESVEPRPQRHRLPHAALDRACERGFREAAARRDQQAQRPAPRLDGACVGLAARL